MITVLVLCLLIGLFGLLLPLAGPWTAMQAGLALLLAAFGVIGALFAGLLGAMLGIVAGLIVIGLFTAGAVLVALLTVPVLLLGGLGLALLGAAPVLVPLALAIGLVWLLVHAARRPAPPPLHQLPAP